jgi:predicted transcriptional regulator
MPDNTAKPVQPFTIEMAASELPQRILDRFPEPPPADARFTVTIEAAEDEEAKFDALRRDIEAGIADIDAGRVSDAEVVFARLRARFAGG